MVFDALAMDIKENIIALGDALDESSQKPSAEKCMQLRAHLIQIIQFHGTTKRLGFKFSRFYVEPNVV